MKRVILIFFFLLTDLLHAQVGKGDTKVIYSDGIEALLAQENRPTVAQLETVAKEIPEFVKQVDKATADLIVKNKRNNTDNTNSFLYSRSNPTTIEALNVDTWSADHVKTYLPNLIGSLEKVFPGGTYAFLGRDVNLWGDALNAFYRNLGQSGRVTFLNASTATFANTTQETLVQFLLQNGLNPQLLTERDPEVYRQLKPFVIFDRTSMGQTSQSTQLLSAAYSFAMQAGVPVELLTQKIFVASSGGGFSPLKNANYNETFKKYTLQLKVVHLQMMHDYQVAKLVAEQEGKSPESVQKPTMTIRYSVPGAQDVEISTMATEFPTKDPKVQWHNTFGAFLQKDGKLVAAPTAAFDRTQKIWTLYNMIKATEVARSNEIFENVFQLALKHNIDSILVLKGPQFYQQMMSKRFKTQSDFLKKQATDKEIQHQKDLHTALLDAQKELLETLPKAIQDSGISSEVSRRFHSKGAFLTLPGHEYLVRYLRLKKTLAGEHSQFQNMNFSAVKNLLTKGLISNEDAGELIRVLKLPVPNRCTVVVQ